MRRTGLLQSKTYRISNFKVTSPSALTDSSTEQFTRTKPWAVNFTALPMRFMRTWFIPFQWASTWMTGTNLDVFAHNRQISLSRPFSWNCDINYFSLHGGTSGSMLKERSSFFAAIGKSNSMQSCPHEQEAVEDARNTNCNNVLCRLLTSIEVQT